MRLHTLKPAAGSKKKSKVIGRGVGSGHGKTSTRGHKGQKARSGGKVGVGFEGGQNPIYRRLPKKGFTNIHRIEYAPVNLGRIESAQDISEFNMEVFASLGLAGKRDKIKILATGELTRAVTVSAHKFSKNAKQKIEAAGGKALEI